MKTSALPKWAHISLTALGSAYLTFVFLSKKIVALLYGHLDAGQPAPMAAYLLAGAVFFSLCYAGLGLLLRKANVCFSCDQQKGRLSGKLFWTVTLIAFAFNIAYLIAHYPGGYSPDNHTQWTQAHTMVFNDHHPFFHTCLYVLLSAVCDSYLFLLICQIAAFSAALGYLAATMRAWGFGAGVVTAICTLILLNSETRLILMYFWKDSAMSVMVLLLLSQLINILLSKGVWLQKWSRWAGHGLLLAGITLVRHNAILFTGPLFVLMFFFMPSLRKTCLKVLVVALAVIIGFKGPIQTLCHVSPASDTYLELVGLPMNILCAVYTEAPDTMPENAWNFMEGFASRTDVYSQFTLGNFNPAKWMLGFTQEQLAKTPLKDFLALTIDTIRQNSILSALSVLELTDMVWEPLGTHYGYEGVGVHNELAYPPVPESLISAFRDFFETLDATLNDPLLKKPVAQLGVLMLVMLLALYLSIHKYHGWKGLWLILPVLCYNFGTMLLLCGPDYRFFHFNCLIAYPLAVLLLSKPRGDQNETCKSN